MSKILKTEIDKKKKIQPLQHNQVIIDYYTTTAM